MTGITETGRRQLKHRFGVGFPRLNYLIHIDDRIDVAYFETPKVACTSIKKFMMDQYVGHDFKLEPRGLVHDRAHSPLQQLSDRTDREALAVFGPNFRRFSFVRNPFSRVLSGYLDKIITNEYERKRHLPLLGFELGARPSLLEFLERLLDRTDQQRDIHFVTQTSLLMVRAVGYDFIGRFEGFDHGLQTIGHEFYGLEAPPSNYEAFGMHHASGANDKILQYFNTRETEIVRSIYAADFRNFGYSKDPAQASDLLDPIRDFTPI